MNERGRPKVFITEARALDFGPATAFGDLKVMELGRLTPYVENLPLAMAYNDMVTHRIKKALVDYIPGHDLICPTGAPTLIVAVGTALGDIMGSHRMLGWDNHTRRYVEYRIRTFKGEDRGEG